MVWLLQQMEISRSQILAGSPYNRELWTCGSGVWLPWLYIWKKTLCGLLRTLAKNNTGRKIEKPISWNHHKHEEEEAFQVHEQWHLASQQGLTTHYSYLFPRLESLWILWAGRNWGLEFPALPLPTMSNSPRWGKSWSSQAQIRSQDSLSINFMIIPPWQYAEWAGSGKHVQQSTV